MKNLTSKLAKYPEVFKLIEKKGMMFCFCDYEDFFDSHDLRILIDIRDGNYFFNIVKKEFVKHSHNGIDYQLIDYIYIGNDKFYADRIETREVAVLKAAEILEDFITDGGVY